MLKDILTSFGPRALISMNCWRFDDRIFAACANIERSARSEYELTNAVTLALARKMRFTMIRKQDQLLDLSSQSDVLKVTHHLTNINPQP